MHNLEKVAKVFGRGRNIGKVVIWEIFWASGHPSHQLAKCCFDGLEMFINLLLLLLHPLYSALFCPATNQLYRPLQDIFQHNVFSAIQQRTEDKGGRIAEKERKQKFQVFGESKNSNYSASLPFSLNLFRSGNMWEIKTNFAAVVTGMIIF